MRSQFSVDRGGLVETDLRTNYAGGDVGERANVDVATGKIRINIKCFIVNHRKATDGCTS